jgi:hypothetical protein
VPVSSGVSFARGIVVLTPKRDELPDERIQGRRIFFLSILSSNFGLVRIHAQSMDDVKDQGGDAAAFMFFRVGPAR